MSCEEVRDRLPDHLLGHSDPGAVRHLRGCASCRADLAALDEGLAALTSAAPDQEPPAELRDRVLWALEEEWSEPEPQTVVFRETSATPRRRPMALLAAAAVVVILAGVVSWGAVQSHRATQNAVAAASYQKFLGTLGGKSVREGKLAATGPQAFDGSAVIYDSMEKQSWLLILAHAPGYKGQADVTISSPTGSMALPAMDFQPNGDTYSIFVTPKDLSSFNRVTISSPTGTVIASGVVGG